MKLFKVTCRGMNFSIGLGTIHGIAYVVAKDSDEAYNKMRGYLDIKQFGTYEDRTLNCVELIADESDYPTCGIKLYV